MREIRPKSAQNSTFKVIIKAQLYLQVTLIQGWICYFWRYAGKFQENTNVWGSFTFFCQIELVKEFCLRQKCIAIQFDRIFERKQSCQIILFHSKSRTFFFPGFFVSAFKDRNRIRKWEKNQFTWTVGLKLGRRICSLSNKLKIRCFDWFARLCNFLWKLWPKNLSLVNSLLCSTLSSKLLSYHVTIKSFVQSTDFSHLSPNSSNVSANL